jgi:uncharacterized membrane protein
MTTSRGSSTTSASPSALSSADRPPGRHPDGGKQHELAHDEPELVDGEVVYPERRPRHTSRRLDVGLQESRYVSPLPSPPDLEQYQKLLPDAPERLLAAGEREQTHRHEIENRLAAIDEAAMPKFYAGQRRGHFISLVLGGGYEGIMLVAVLQGYAVEGIAGAAAGIAGMVWAISRGPSDSDSPDHEHPAADPK